MSNVENKIKELETNISNLIIGLAIVGCIVFLTIIFLVVKIYNDSNKNKEKEKK